MQIGLGLRVAISTHRLVRILAKHFRTLATLACAAYLISGMPALVVQLLGTGQPGLVPAIYLLLSLAGITGAALVVKYHVERIGASILLLCTALMSVEFGSAKLLLHFPSMLKLSFSLRLAFVEGTEAHAGINIIPVFLVALLLRDRARSLARPTLRFKLSRALLLVSAASIPLLLGWRLWCSSCSSKAEHVVDTFLQALADGDTQVARGQLCSAVDAVLGPEQMRGIAVIFDGYRGVHLEPLTLGITTLGDSSLAGYLNTSGEVTYTNGSRRSVEVGLVHVNGNWKMHTFRWVWVPADSTLRAKFATSPSPI